MERSGRRETTSTRAKSLSARSRREGSVSGKSIIVPRIRASLGEPEGIVSLMLSSSWTGMSEGAPTESFRLQIRLIFERMQVTAEVSSLAPVVALLPGLPVYGFSNFRPVRGPQFGFGQKELRRGRKPKAGIFRFSATEDQLH